ncbi:adenylate kinase 8 [Calliopsis andreniformis]|uniref:adenylate kinase 8 n=1 Tax=Calliopsis andreniformis TaxID=337506 RepID=UPI003FCE13AD
MSGIQEAEKRIHSINAQFVAYLEKHRIYELFHEIATQLVIQKPDDHLAFMKQYLHLAAKRIDVARIILIAPPKFDKEALARVLQEELDVRPLTLKQLRTASSKTDDECHCDESEDLAITMKKILKNGAFHQCGWLLIDLPRTKKEARIFQGQGIIPTHVIQLIISPEFGKNVKIFTIIQYCILLLSFFYIDNWKNDFTDTNCLSGIPGKPSRNSKEGRYLRNLAGLREAYANCLIEIEVGFRSIDELGKDCAKLIKTAKKHCGTPTLFRIALIGSRGSGCTTVAKYLAERFNLIHIDYDYIAEQARLQETPLGEMLRLFEYRWGERPKPDIRIKIIEKYISEYECLKRGWVLTGYPKSVEDFKLLDLSPTPPNRVIFMEVNGDICRERLLNRRYDIVTGSKHNLSAKNYIYSDDRKLSVHPRDYRLIVERDLQEYEENVGEMMQYAGESAVKIDGNEEERVVREKVEAYLMRPAPNFESRIPKPPSEIDPMDIEFDPDDEPESKVLDNIRAAEPTYTFI